MNHYPSIAETLAEELIDLRAQQARLKTRESEVRNALLSLVAPDQGMVQIAAPTAAVRIETRVALRFDASRLPDHIRSDPRYKVQKETTYVRILPSSGRTLAARSGPDGVDFDVIER
ncbi:hypothetical protein [Tateyamaria sp. SN3-11]|uniref:hypothetical protein n=1 Tax=Tateyamaria sp. SN3-11 TaxID=3092147 RepID=UPI0039E8C07B